MAGHDADSCRMLATIIRVFGSCLLLAAVCAAPASAFERTGVLSEPYRGKAPILHAGLCPDGGPCQGYDEPSYQPHQGRGREWRPAVHGAPYPAEAVTVYDQEDCIEEQPRTYRYVAHPPQHYDSGYWDEPCGIRCWYRKLREGYCGRGCDYYRFRLTEFPEGKLSRYRHRRSACRNGH